MYYKIAQFSLSPRKNTNTIGDVFIAQPDSLKEELAGKLFIIIEIENSTSRDLKIINFLIDNINFNYYNSEKILLRERISSLKVEHIFEAALAKVNKNFLNFLETNKYDIDFNSLNITVGVIHKDSLYLANHGKNKAFLIYKNKNDNNYDSVDIFNKPDPKGQTAHDKNNFKKIFSNVISGNIPEGGQFIISNETLPEYLSKKQIIDISSTLPPISAVEQIKNTLSKINSYISFLGIIIKSSKLYKKENLKINTEIKKQDSIVHLNKTEEETENLLTPSGIINIKKIIKKPSELIKTKTLNKINQKQNLELKDKILVKKNYFNFKFLKNIFNGIKNILIYLINFVFFLFKIISKKKNIIVFSKNLKILIISKIKNNIEKYKNIKKRNKILLSIFIVFLFLFIINIGIQKKEEKKEKQEKNYQELNNLIEQKENQAEANLLYSNDKGALKNYEEMKKLLDQLPQETEEQKKKHEEFKQKYNQFLEKIRKITKINPKELSNFNNLIKKAKPDNITISPENNKIYAGDSQEQSIYILDTKNNISTVLTEPLKPVKSLLYPAKSDSGQIYYYNDNSIINFDIKSESLGNLSIPLGKVKIKAADTYNNRLYLLDTEKGQILRFNRKENGFSSPYAWSKANSNLKNAVDMAIDGNIYILLENGELIKYLRGEIVDFKLELVDPPLLEANKIIVSKENDYIYILEAKNKRIIIYNKKGQFQKQYWADNLDNIKDFQINEKTKTIYFLNNSSVYKIKIEDL